MRDRGGHDAAIWVITMGGMRTEEAVRLKGRSLDVTVRRGARDGIRDLLVAWYRAHAAARLP